MNEAASTDEPGLRLFSRQGCHLCEDMMAQLTEYSQQMSFSFQVIDIDSSDDLRARYNDVVPLLTSAGGEVCRYFLDLVALQHAVAAVTDQ